MHTPIYTPEYEAALVPQVAAMKGSLEYTSLQLIEPFNESLSNKTTQEIMKTVDDVWQLTVFNNPNIADTPLQYRNTPLSELNVTQFPSNKVVTIVDTRMECNLVQNPINGSDPINNVNSGIPFPGSTDKFSYCAIDSTYTCASPQNPPVNAQSLNYTAPDSEDGSNSNIFNSFINYVCSGSGKASNVDKLVAKNANVHIQGGKGNGQLEGAEGKMFDQVVADCIVGNNNVYTNAQKRFEISDDRSAGRNSNAMFSNNTNRQAAGLVGMAVISPIVILLSAGLILGLAGVCYLIQRYKNSGQNKTTENDIENPKTNVELDNIEGKKFR